VGDDSHVGFGQKIPGCKVKCETVRCRDATASSFVAKVRDEVFAHLRSRRKIRRCSIRILVGAPIIMVVFVLVFLSPWELSRRRFPPYHSSSGQAEKFVIVGGGGYPQTGRVLCLEVNFILCVGFTVMLSTTHFPSTYCVFPILNLGYLSDWRYML
jgi:hypothetical protein